jgi:hypothetical protein
VVVTRLVRRGLVTRARDGGDGRRVEIALTARGRAALERAPAAAQDRLIAALGVLGPTARRTLAGALGRLVDAMALPEQAPPMFFESTPQTQSTKKPSTMPKRKPNQMQNQKPSKNPNEKRSRGNRN